MQPKFRPSFELLESRLVPTVTAVINNGVAFLDGNNQNDWVNIVSNTDPNTGDPTLTVSYNGPSGTVIRNIDMLTETLAGTVVRLGGGRDRFTLRTDPQTGFDLFANFNLYVDLGSGNDSASVRMGKNITGENTVVNVSILGGEGKDSINVQFWGDVNEGATLNVNLDGGKDRDTITVAQESVVQGSINFLANGGSGADMVRASFLAQTSEIPGVAGSLNAQVTGGSGRDSLTLLASQEDGANVTTDLRISGTHNDTAFYTDGVFVSGLKSSHRHHVPFTSFLDI